MSDRGREGLSWSGLVFLHLSLLPHTHTRTHPDTHTLGLPTLPIRWRANLGLGVLPHNTKIPKHLNIYALRHPFMSLQSLTKCQDQSQWRKWWEALLDTLEKAIFKLFICLVGLEFILLWIYEVVIAHCCSTFGVFLIRYLCLYSFCLLVPLASSIGELLTSSVLHKHLIWNHCWKRVCILWIGGLSFTER